MNEQITLTATVTAWLPSFNTVTSLMDAVRKANALRVVDLLTLTSTDMSKGSDPYALVGEAEVRVTIKTPDELVAAQVKALNAELEAVRIESAQRQAMLLEKISKLQALTYEAPAEVAEAQS
jgi:hypothetical protein